MQNNLTVLYQQFQQKQQQFSQIGSNINNFLLEYKDKGIKNRLILRDKLGSLRQKLKTIKLDFVLMKKDIEVYRDIPNSFIMMVVDLPRIYENFWESREMQLIRNLEIKEEECRMLKEKLDKSPNNYDEIRLQVENTESKDKGIDDQQKQQRLQQFQKQETELDIVNMDILIKDVYCDRITQQFSQEQDLSIVKNLNQRKSVNYINSERFHQKRKCQTSLQFMKNGLNKRDSMNSIFSQRKKKENKKNQFIGFVNQQSPQKDKFWKDLTKLIKNNNKLNTHNKQNHSSQIFQSSSRLLGTESQILGSKMNEYRRALLSRNRNSRQF